MRGDVSTIKERLDVAEVIGSYVKLEKSGNSLKGRCPFHNEKTPSFFVSPARQSYYCFGCGKKGDIFTFVEETEGLDFKGALKLLADRAGIELVPERPEIKSEKDKLYAALEDSTLFFQQQLEKSAEAQKYLESRGLTAESIKTWRLGYATDEWRTLSAHLTTLGYGQDTLMRAGLIKRSEDHKESEPYDIFRGRLIFPLADASGKVIAFSGRALAPDAVPKYLNSPDTPLFTKSEVLYGLDKAKEEIRKKDYAVLVEGQMDIVLSHQAGVKNTVASSGTAFTQAHLERLKRLSTRIILAFDADGAGQKAAERSSALALSLGMEVKVAELPVGKDPADMVRESPESWKEALRGSKHAIEIFLGDILKIEKDSRKIGKAVEKKILPLVLLVGSSMERSHFISVIAKRTGLREEIIWEDLKRAKAPDLNRISESQEKEDEGVRERVSLRDQIEKELVEVVAWRVEQPAVEDLRRQEGELRQRLAIMELEQERGGLRASRERGEGDEQELSVKIEVLNRSIDEQRRKIV